MTAHVLLAASLLAQQGDSPPPRSAPTAEEVRAAIDRGLALLVREQNRDGSWGGPRNKTFTDSFANAATHDAWIAGTTGLVATALVETGKTAEAQSALDRGLEYLVRNAPVKRPAEWDIDNVWGMIYGLQGLSRAMASPRYSSSPRREALREAALILLEDLARYQSPNGGWAYYASPGSAWRPEWATSFTTAVGVLALLDARAAGLPVNEKVLQAAVRTVKRCRLPTGAYTYSWSPIPSPGRLTFFDQVKGSLSRIQVGNLALLRAGERMPPAELERGLGLFFEHHKFLDCGLRKPIPHEAYYAVAAYFYLFGHCYAAEVIEALPPASRARYWPQLQREVLKTQEPDGGFWDFWISSHTKPYGTAFAILALERSLRG